MGSVITICLDRAFTFFTHKQQSCFEVEMDEPAHLKDVLARLGIPPGEVHLVVINGEAVESQDIWITSRDKVKLFPPFGGG
jgi:sulfur carrier protein ThiS